MKSLKAYSIGLILFAQTALAGNGNVSGTKISIDNGVDSALAQQLNNDIETLLTSNMSNPDPMMLKLMKITNATGAATVGWLQDRVHFIIADSVNLQTALAIYNDNSFTFPATPMPIVPHPTNSSGTAETAAVNSATTSSSDIKTVMSNVGGAIYLDGKQIQSALQLDTGSQKIAVESPRAGIIQIGEGFTMNPFGAAISDTSKALFAFRMATLFHEARHSDGNGPSTGFLHAICTEGDYAGYAACDANLNGPYTVGSIWLNSYEKSCSSCSQVEHHAISVLALDSASRIIKFVTSTNNASIVDMQTSALQTELQTCQLLKSVGGDLTSVPDCKDLDALQNKISDLQKGSGITTTPTTNWDDTPEGNIKMYASLAAAKSNHLQALNQCVQRNPAEVLTFTFTSDQDVANELKWTTKQWNEFLARILVDLPKQSEILQSGTRSKKEIEKRIHGTPSEVVIAAARIGRLMDFMRLDISHTEVDTSLTVLQRQAKVKRMKDIGLKIYEHCAINSEMPSALRALCYKGFAKLAVENQEANEIFRVKVPEYISRIAATLN